VILLSPRAPPSTLASQKEPSMASGDDIRVVLVDDLGMVRTGFRLIIDNEDDRVVVGDATNGLEAIELCRTRRVDVVMMDTRMPELDGLAATRAVLELPDPPRVIVLTTFGLDEYVTETIRSARQDLCSRMHLRPISLTLFVLLLPAMRCCRLRLPKRCSNKHAKPSCRRCATYPASMN
jgi:CheY-like chemotaxis protein